MGIKDYIMRKKAAFKTDMAQKKAALKIINKKKKAAYYRALEKEELKDAGRKAREKVTSRKSFGSIVKVIDKKTIKKGRNRRVKRKSGNSYVKKTLESDKGSYDPYKVKNVFE